MNKEDLELETWTLKLKLLRLKMDDMSVVAITAFGRYAEENNKDLTQEEDEEGE